MGLLYSSAGTLSVILAKRSGPSTNHLIKQVLNFLDFLLTAFCIGNNVINFTKRKNGRHFERQFPPVGQKNMRHHSSHVEVNKFLLAYVILFKHI